ncbi:hypothetical protein EPUL_002708 [Erysiphe pulchra]|uniref:RNase H type-1 domain-containing protein n=1 Tax=Erysiphe pulchra TaxID=225359 RepID=A0A2S4PXI6_9PEZI|nr:hypothetical protein EPUL_002708 [Erysiphe pulchra]
MTRSRGLLNLVGPYLKEMEESCSEAGVEFLALISEGVSRAIRGKEYMPNYPQIHLTDLLPNAIALRFGNATVERQETWTTFILSLIPKLITTLDGKCDPLEKFILQEPGFASDRDEVLIRHIAWTNRSKESSDTHGENRTVKIQHIRERKQIITCEKCHGFHVTRTCARKKMYSYCGMEAHDGSCSHPPQCLNCRGPHESTDASCPARPRRKNRALVRLPSPQLRQISTAGKKEYIKSTEAALRSDKILDQTVYSDGALNKDGTTGAAYCIFRDPYQEISHGTVPLGRTVEAYDAEIHGALEGLRAALNHTLAKYATSLVVFLDNEEAAIRLYTGIPTPSSSKQILEFQKLQHDWEHRPNSRASSAGKVSIVGSLDI